MNAVAECMQQILARPGWSIDRIAEEIGVTSDSLRRLRRGLVEYPRFDIVAQLHRLAGRSVDQLIGIEVKASVAAPDLEARMAALEADLRVLKIAWAQGGASPWPAPTPIITTDETAPGDLRRDVGTAARQGLARAGRERRPAAKAGAKPAAKKKTG